MLENLEEHLGRGSKNILGPHPPTQQLYRTPSQSRLLHYCTQGITRNIKEATDIHVNDPSLNRNLGKYQLPTSGTKSCKTLQLFNINKTSSSPYRTSTTPNPLTIVGGTNFLVCIPCGGAIPTPQSYLTPPRFLLIPIYPTPHFSGAICGKYTHLFM